MTEDDPLRQWAGISMALDAIRNLESPAIRAIEAAARRDRQMNELLQSSLVPHIEAIVQHSKAVMEPFSAAFERLKQEENTLKKLACEFSSEMRMYSSAADQARKLLAQDSRVFEQLVASARSIGASQALLGKAGMLASVRHAVEALEPDIRAITGEGDLAGGASTVDGNSTVVPNPSALELKGYSPSVQQSDRLSEPFGEWYGKLSPTTRIIFWIILTHVFLPLWDESVIRTFLRDKDSAAQQIVIQQINQYYGATTADVLRCVRSDGLRVRDQPSSDAAVIDKLGKQQAVELLESKGSWSRVRYYSGEGILREGWAASGYLLRFKCEVIQ